MLEKKNRGGGGDEDSRSKEQKKLAMTKGVEGSERARLIGGSVRQKGGGVGIKKASALKLNMLGNDGKRQGAPAGGRR